MTVLILFVTLFRRMVFIAAIKSPVYATTIWGKGGWVSKLADEWGTIELTRQHQSHHEADEACKPEVHSHDQ